MHVDPGERSARTDGRATGSLAIAGHLFFLTLLLGRSIRANKRVRNPSSTHPAVS